MRTIFNQGGSRDISKHKIGCYFNKAPQISAFNSSILVVVPVHLAFQPFINGLDLKTVSQTESIRNMREKKVTKVQQNLTVGGSKEEKTLGL